MAGGIEETRRVPQWRRGMLPGLRVFLCASAISASFGLFGPTHTAAAIDIDIVVPAYFYPSAGSPWNAMTAAADDVRITAIMNPGSGPGNFKDSNYVAAVNSFRAAGGRVIAYVDTSYTAVPMATVKANIDKYNGWYEIDGIFIDQMSNTGPISRLNYYNEIYQYVKSIDPNWELMGNPGTNTLEQYLTMPTADRLMTSENYGSEYAEYENSPWVMNYPRSAFVHLIHSEPSSAVMLADLALAVERNVGGIYITNDPLVPNPWDTLPSYWNALVAAVGALEADFNADGTVDAADYSVWRDSFGQTGEGLAADANGDNEIDEADYARWRKYFGASAGGGAGGAATSQGVAAPEPSTTVLIALPLVSITAAVRLRLRRFTNE